MFKVTQGMKQSWAAMDRPKATPGDITLIEASIGARLPASYVEFVTKYGFVIFGRDPDERQAFTYTIEKPSQREVRESAVSYLFDPQKMLTINRYMTSADDPDDETRPMLPAGYLAVGSDPGHGCILLELEGTPGRVWYWPQSDWRWGTEDNTRLGFVAQCFDDFVSNLRPDKP